MAGFVYVMSNPAFPDRIKIGKSKKDPTTDRVNELNQTGVPEAFTVEYYGYVSDETKLEKAVHKKLSDRRPNKKKEFFTVSISEAVREIREISIQFGGIKYEEVFFKEYSRTERKSHEFNEEDKRSYTKPNITFSDKFGDYIGETKGNLEHGFGTRFFKNGNKYVGYFIEGKFSGKGKLTLANGPEYEGEFKDGLYNGEGTLKFRNGNSFKGSFKNSQRHGYGTLTFRGGSKLYGVWQTDKRHGNFIFSENGEDTKEIYFNDKRVS